MTAKNFIEVEMLPAGHGDALLVRYRAGHGVARMLIDGGPSYTYDHLLDRLLALPPGDRHFELLVITHIDGDHIDGIIRLLQEDLNSLGITFDDIWFNGTDQMNQVLAATDQMGAKQGEYLQALLKHHDLAWNVAFGGGPVMAAPKKPITLGSGAKVRLLSPHRDDLVALLNHWTKIIAGEGYRTGETAEALKRLKKDRRLRALADERDKLGARREPQGETVDRSKANRSSIAFTLEVPRRKVLFGGDASHEVLKASIDEFTPASKRLKLQAFKVPHHGSASNLSVSLLDRIDCKDFLISTNGSYFNHPDNAAIERIIQRADDANLWFNYATEETALWLDPIFGVEDRVHMPSGLTYRK